MPTLPGPSPPATQRPGLAAWPPAPAPRPRARIPFRAHSTPVTWAILAANVAIFGLSVALGERTENWIVTRFGQDRGAVADGEVWRLITAVFLHANLMHISLNMLAHVYLGRLMERIFGHGRFLVLYLASALSGAIFFQTLSDALLGLGASGAVYGVFGAFLALKSALRPSGRLTPVWSFVVWTAVVLGLDRLFAQAMEVQEGMGIAASAHLGGFVGGAALGFSWLNLIVPVSPRHRRLRVAVPVAFVAVLAGLAVFTHVKGDHGGWNLLAVDRRLEEHLRGRDFAGAVAAWSHRREEGAGREASEYRELGYILYDRLMAEREDVLASRVLADLVDQAFDALEEASRVGLPPTDLLNEVAWYCALRGERLAEALALADQAVRRTAPGERRWPWHIVFGRAVDRRKLGMYLNTRGWIQLRLRDDAAALRNLEEAARIQPAGANFLYLALARFALNQVDASRAAAREAREAGGLTPYENELLAQLERDLGET